MEQSIQKIISERYNTLPISLKDFISNPTLEETLHTIAQKYNLNKDTEVLLENEVMFVLLGFEPSEEFMGQLAICLPIDPTTTMNIADEITTSIFNHIGPELHALDTEYLQDGAIVDSAESILMPTSSEETPTQTPEIHTETEEESTSVPAQLQPTDEITVPAPAAEPAPSVSEAEVPAPAPEPVPVEPPEPVIVPSYAKPLTDTPRYTDDPYRESPHS